MLIKNALGIAQGEDIREPIFADERLNTPEIVACGVQVITHFQKFAGTGVRRVSALNLDCAQPARRGR